MTNYSGTPITVVSSRSDNVSVKRVSHRCILLRSTPIRSGRCLNTSITALCQYAVLSCTALATIYRPLLNQGISSTRVPQILVNSRLFNVLSTVNSMASHRTSVSSNSRCALPKFRPIFRQDYTNNHRHIALFHYCSGNNRHSHNNKNNTNNSQNPKFRSPHLQNNNQTLAYLIPTVHC